MMTVDTQADYRKNRATLSYGLIGFGRIGQRVVRCLAAKNGSPTLVAVLVRPEQKAAAEAALGASLVHTSINSFLAIESAVTIECASATALRNYGISILSSGSDLLPLSLAALTDRDFETDLFAAATRGPGRLEIPAGAMGSIDFLSAAREDALRSVVFRATYPAARWRGTVAEEMIDLENLTSANCFYRSTVREAVIKFPRHINVAVGVALAGLGLDDTRVELFANPLITQATFEVEAEAGPGPARLTIYGRNAGLGADPIDYTTFSLVRALCRRTDRVIV